MTQKSPEIEDSTDRMKRGGETLQRRSVCSEDFHSYFAEILSSSVDYNATTDNGDLSPWMRGGSAAKIDATLCDETLGELRICQLLGKGAFGEVYLAQILGHEKRLLLDSGIRDDVASQLPGYCALKAFHHGSPRQLRDFAMRELSALKAVSSRRIPPLLSYSLDEPPFYLITPYYCEGCLADRPEDSGPLPESEAWTLLTHLLEAVRDAHGASVLHLDIKPGNILRDGSGGYLLADFGISQCRLDSQNKLGVGLGTPGYSAPEQWQLLNDEIDMRTDLFAIGMTMWFLLTGTKRNSRFINSMHEAVAKGGGRPVPTIAEVREGVPPLLARIVDRMTNTQKTERPPSAADLLQEISIARSQTASAIDGSGRALAPDEIEALVAELSDKSIAETVCKELSDGVAIRSFAPDETLGCVGERAYVAFLLLKGRVRIEREGVTLCKVEREGSFLGEISALTFDVRTATMIAETEVIALRLNASDLEQFIGDYPSLALRMMRSLARQVVRESRLSSMNQPRDPQNSFTDE